MSEVKLYKFVFKPTKKQVWLDWCEELKTRQAEVIETLKNEGVLSESCFLSADGLSIYYFMEAKDFAKAKEAVKKSMFKIDAEHKTARQSSIDFVEELACLFHFNATTIHSKESVVDQ